MTRPAAVYRHFDAEGELLYIGRSHNPVARLDAHMARSPWAKQITSVTLDWFDSDDEAKAAEREAIAAECPPCNRSRIRRPKRLSEEQMGRHPLGMTLAQYLAETNTPQCAIAACLGVRHATVSAWVSGGSRPRLRLAVAIERMTDGAVPVTSWFSA